jgi:uncharacterized repeat protein (TIGR03803 family)
MPASQTIQPRSRHKFQTPVAALMFSVLMPLTLFMNTANGQIVTTLYSFTGQPSEYPQEVMLAQGRDGQLYGTTTDGGIDGSIFKVSTSRIFTHLFSFDNTDGDVPGEGMTLASDGNFYGVAPDGGTSGNGVFFKITPSGIFTPIYYFTGGSDGANPFAPPIQASDGNLYGTTGHGAVGPTVYKYTPSGNLSTIYQFNGGYVGAPLIQGSDGLLYGTTGDGGWASCGTIFKMTTAGILLQSYPFPCKTGGAFPSNAPLLEASDGNFYGTTVEGGVKNQGTIFKMTPDFKVSIVYTFMGHTQAIVDGASPGAGLIQATDGNLYGTTFKGGSTGTGTLFRISTNGDYQLLSSFAGAIGTNPQGTLMQHTNGMLYGTAPGGGTKKLGTVYKVDVGLGPFVTFVQPTGKVGQTVQILGQGFTGATSVTFNSVAATFTVPSPTFMLATIPSGATTGPVVVTTPTATLTSNHNFTVLP